MTGKQILVIVAILLTGMLIWLVRNRDAKTEPSAYKVGALYSITDEKGYRIAKVLVIEDDVIHVRVYKQAFSERPATIDPSNLTLGTIHDADGFGMGHLPINPRKFDSWRPAFLMDTTLAEDELEGYREWKAAGGGVWD